MEHIIESLTTLLVVFIAFVGFPWVVMHYRTLQKKTHGLSVEEHQLIESLSETADAMEKRIDVLEAILDQESPSWRNKYHAGE